MIIWLRYDSWQWSDLFYLICEWCYILRHELSWLNPSTMKLWDLPSLAEARSFSSLDVGTCASQDQDRLWWQSKEETYPLAEQISCNEPCFGHESCGSWAFVRVRCAWFDGPHLQSNLRFSLNSIAYWLGCAHTTISKVGRLVSVGPSWIYIIMNHES